MSFDFEQHAATHQQTAVTYKIQADRWAYYLRQFPTTHPEYRRAYAEWRRCDTLAKQYTTKAKTSHFKATMTALISTALGVAVFVYIYNILG